MLQPLYESKQECICCGEVYASSRVRPSFKKTDRMDSDFCGYYKNDINPDYYVIRVCPHCGFASTENGFKSLSDAQKDNYYKQAGANWKGRSYTGERNVEEALECYKLALLSAQATNAPERNIAALLHHIAWLYRYMQNKEQEQRFLNFALHSYIKVFEEESNAAVNARLMYMIGELYRRTSNDNEAVRWFSRVINTKEIMDGAMIAASRAQWQLIREEHEAKRLEKIAEQKEGKL